MLLDTGCRVYDSEGQGLDGLAQPHIISQNAAFSVTSFPCHHPHKTFFLMLHQWNAQGTLGNIAGIGCGSQAGRSRLCGGEVSVNLMYLRLWANFSSPRQFRSAYCELASHL